MEKFERELIKVLRQQNSILEDMEVALRDLAEALREEKVTVVLRRGG